MAVPEGKAYTSGHRVAGDGSVTFACSQSRKDWPWLELPPWHPIVVQTQNFWTSVGASAALGTLEEGRWSALTWTDWKTGDAAAQHAARGIFSRTMVEDKLAFETCLFDAQGRPVVTMRGRGVVFRNRDFEAWRAEAKREAAGQGSGESFAYAARELLGISPREWPLVSPLSGNRAMALLTPENALMPAHPYFSGSGDHVNTPHLAEAARQIVSLLREGEPFRVTGGEMEMRRYVELGCPFELEVEAHEGDETRIEVRQLGRACARIALIVSPISA